MILKPGYYLLEDSTFTLFEETRYKLALDLTGVSSAKLKWLMVLSVMDDRHYKFQTALSFIEEVHSNFNFGGM